MQLVYKLNSTIVYSTSILDYFVARMKADSSRISRNVGFLSILIFDGWT